MNCTQLCTQHYNLYAGIIIIIISIIFCRCL